MEAVKVPRLREKCEDCEGNEQKWEKVCHEVGIRTVNGSDICDKRIKNMSDAEVLTNESS